MATVKLYFDKRAIKRDGTAPIKLMIGMKSQATMISTNVSVAPKNWDDRTSKVINVSQKKFYNDFLEKMVVETKTELLKLQESVLLANMSLGDIRQHFLEFFNYASKETKRDDLFVERFMHFIEMKEAKRTKEIYMSTLSRIRAFDANADNLIFTDIDVNWLQRFDEFLKVLSPSQNARSIHFRNIRAVFNDAIDDDITNFYPFRKFKIKTVATRKRALSVEDLRFLFNYPVNEHQRKPLDFFKLSFYLIGINMGDLSQLMKIKDGRVDYIRSKTHKFYSIKVEPEAMEIIEKYRGKKYLLNILDNYRTYKDFVKRMNINLQKIGPEKLITAQGKIERHPIFPDLTSYWARHTWATIAASLDIPKETIAHALGHGGNTVTDIYIDFDRDKIDEANRKVIDYVTKGNKQ